LCFFDVGWLHRTRGLGITYLEQVVLVVVMPMAVRARVMILLMLVEIFLFTPCAAVAIRTAPADDAASVVDPVLDQLAARIGIDSVAHMTLPVIGGVTDMLVQITDTAVAASAIFSLAAK